jgi:hypothetical protein
MQKRLLVGKKVEAEENVLNTIHCGLCYSNKVNIRTFKLIVHLMTIGTSRFLVA